MKMIKLTEKSVNKMYGIAEQISEAMEEFMECLEKLEMGNRDEDWDEDWDEEDEYDEEDPSDMESGNRSHRQGYRGGMGNRGPSGSGYRRGMGNRGEIADRRGVKGTGRYSRY